MTLLVSVTVLIVIPLLAWQGRGYRGLYLAVAFIVLLLTVVTFSLPGVPIDPNASAAEIAGGEFVDMYATSVGGCLIATTIGAILGACLYRRPSQIER
jgi:hypothetical protein